MNPIIINVLQVLNQLEVRGEKNHEMVLFCIQQLKPLQTMELVPADAESTKGKPAREVK